MTIKHPSNPNAFIQTIRVFFDTGVTSYYDKGKVVAIMAIYNDGHTIYEPKNYNYANTTDFHQTVTENNGFQRVIIQHSSPGKYANRTDPQLQYIHQVYVNYTKSTGERAFNWMSLYQPWHSSYNSIQLDKSAPSGSVVNELVVGYNIDNRTVYATNVGFTSKWNNWGACSKICGSGQQIRTGVSGTGKVITETRTCNNQSCPVNGGWSDWENWNSCSKTCGGGKSTRTRKCNNPSPLYGGADCSGSHTETRTCNDQPCPINGGLSPWSGWGVCSKSCGGGTNIRTRKCNNPSPLHGGANCVGNLTETGSCNDQPCPINGGLSLWSDWSTPSKTCGSQTVTRTRKCNNPTPTNGGADCVGQLVESKTYNQLCPVNGGWSDWENENTCSKSCGGGTVTRTRKCNNPSPANGGDSCVGSNTETRTCNDQPCPINGGLSPWSGWGVCSKSCDGGTVARTRNCNNPSPSHGGANCVGNLTDTKKCNDKPCPVDGGLSPWSEWSKCSKGCGGGISNRTRKCNNPPPANGGANCVGNLTETKKCNDKPCPVDGEWGEWGGWTTHPQMSDKEIQTRPCKHALFGGKRCSGINIRIRDKVSFIKKHGKIIGIIIMVISLLCAICVYYSSGSNAYRQPIQPIQKNHVENQRLLNQLWIKQ